jgi:hypothetical protein
LPERPEKARLRKQNPNRPDAASARARAREQSIGLAYGNFAGIGEAGGPEPPGIAK